MYIVNLLYISQGYIQGSMKGEPLLAGISLGGSINSVFV